MINTSVHLELFIIYMYRYIVEKLLNQAHMVFYGATAVQWYHMIV